MSITKPIHIKTNNLSRISELRKVSALAVAFLSVSATFATVDSQSIAPHIIASHGVDSASNISAVANGKAALLCDYNDMVVIDLGRVIPKGESYQITWKKKAGSTSNSAATLKIMESGSTSNFSPQTYLPQTSVTKNFITSEFKALVETRFVMINVASPIDDAIEIDAVHSFTKAAHSTSEKTSNRSTSDSSEKTEQPKTKKNTSVQEIPEQNTYKEPSKFTSSSYLLALSGLKLEELTTDAVLRPRLFWENSRTALASNRLKLTKEKTGDPPEQADSNWWTSAKLEIRPPPI